MEDKPEIKNNKEKVGQEQIHGLLFSDKLSWQAIIYDLINTEQLNPWDVDICLLANKYLEKVRTIEEGNFFVSSKVLFAASLLLRMKSEILLNYYIPNLDSILFGKKDEKKYVRERIEFDDEVPELIPRTPLPRGRKVSLHELMSALGRAIKTETRRIKRIVVDRQREFDTIGAIPRKKIDLKGQITTLYNKLRDYFKDGGDKVGFSNFCHLHGKDKIAHFLPLLYLDNQHKVLLEQESHFEEIWIWLKQTYEEKHAEILETARKEVEEAMNGEDDSEESIERPVENTAESAGEVVEGGEKEQTKNT